MQCIAWQLPGGNISISYPVEPAHNGESQSDYLDRIAAKAAASDPNLSGATRLANVEHTSLPARRFRSSWRQNAGVIAVHLPTARQQRLAELRKERDALLDASDVLLLRAIDGGNSVVKANVIAYRQQLRDEPTTITTEMSLVNSAEELAAYVHTWPTVPSVPNVI